VLLADSLYKERVLALCLGGAVHRGGKVGLDLEKFLEILIVGVQQVIEQRVADEHDLDVERDRLRFQRYRADEAELGAQLLDADVTVFERALECVPGQVIDEHLAHRQHQVATVGPMERPWLDHSKVGGDRSHESVMFDATN
jgi:hypothetical protein